MWACHKTGCVRASPLGSASCQRHRQRVSTLRLKAVHSGQGPESIATNGHTAVQLLLESARECTLSHPPPASDRCWFHIAGQVVGFTLEVHDPQLGATQAHLESPKSASLTWKPRLSLRAVLRRQLRACRHRDTPTCTPCLPHPQASMERQGYCQGRAAILKVLCKVWGVILLWCTYLEVSMHNANAVQVLEPKRHIKQAQKHRHLHACNHRCGSTLVAGRECPPPSPRLVQSIAELSRGNQHRGGTAVECY